MSAQSDWAQLFRIACAMIRQVNAEQEIIDHWSFGGGTAMMLQIDHRISHDVDIFLADPQVLPFLDPQKHDFHFEVGPADYKGDGARLPKLGFEFGEIDFIVAQSLTSSPTTQSTVEGEMVLLETIPEIIAKKIYHRGDSIVPRDIFDIAAAGEKHAEAIIRELASYRNSVTSTLAAIDRLKPDFVSAVINQLSIKDPYLPIANIALERTQELLRAV
ncbi:nucleotidyl transferase AbiEii/AbiGii toxin family protein [Bradyrhizobium monzae]|uniref:nucleotidyl transferase AbiEii/AbiGii toxin family protein n=1 Tax=Bradyrhizobium sp. Oc8 TaxID=2876780 RepID=UPI001F2CBD2E